MNILITSIGRRTNLIEYFKKELGAEGNIVTADLDNTAAGLYHADKSYIVPRIDSPNYIDTLLEICEKENIHSIISLIDPELNIISKNKKVFEEKGIEVFISEYKSIYNCFDKYKAYKEFKKHGLPTPITFDNIEKFVDALSNKEIQFPVILKPRTGSGGKDVMLIDDMELLEYHWQNNDSQIIQEYIDGISIDVDFYVDKISKEMISIFPKERILIRSGESDKAISLNDEKIFSLVKDMAKAFDLIGPLCCDIFMKDGKFYILEINPRFGGSYPMAHSCGVNFPRYILNNMKGIINKQEIGNFENNVYMIKNDNYLTVKSKSELLS